MRICSGARWSKNVNGGKEKQEIKSPRQRFAQQSPALPESAQKSIRGQQQKRSDGNDFNSEMMKKVRMGTLPLNQCLSFCPVYLKKIFKTHCKK